MERVEDFLRGEPLRADDEMAEAVYQRLKFKLVAQLPPTEWALTADELSRAIWSLGVIPADCRHRFGRQVSAPPADRHHDSAAGRTFDCRRCHNSRLARFRDFDARFRTRH